MVLLERYKFTSQVERYIHGSYNLFTIIEADIIPL